MSTISRETELVMSLSSLQSHLQKNTDRSLSVHGISSTEFFVMFHLHGAPNKTMRRIDLAERVGLSASGVTRLLLPMEKIRLVEKQANPRDARVSMVKLSKAGERVLSEALVSYQHCADELLQRLDAGQRDALLKLTRALL